MNRVKVVGCVVGGLLLAVLALQANTALHQAVVSSHEALKLVQLLGNQTARAEHARSF